MNENMESVKERPILFSGPMVRAILNGQKHVTRRPIVALQKNGNPALRAGRITALCFDVYSRIWLFRDTKRHWNDLPDILPYCPFGAPGDRLWVRETWAENVPGCEAQGGYGYRADHHNASGDGPVRIKWRPSIHMPRVASRLTLEITAISVEPLQAIMEDEVWDEGIEELDGHFSDADLCATAKKHGLMVEDAITTFAHLWDAIYARRGLGWADNPYAWVVRFRPLEAA